MYILRRWNWDQEHWWTGYGWTGDREQAQRYEQPPKGLIGSDEILEYVVEIAAISWDLGPKRGRTYDYRLAYRYPSRRAAEERAAQIGGQAVSALLHGDRWDYTIDRTEVDNIA